MIEKQIFVELFVKHLKENEKYLSDGFNWYGEDEKELERIAEELFQEMIQNA